MFDTLRYSKVLEAAGVNRDQAEAHVQVMAEIIEGDVATKQDVKELKEEIKHLEYRIVFKLGAIVVTVVSLGLAVMAGLIQAAGK